jgi:hypothetical protein
MQVSNQYPRPPNAHLVRNMGMDGRSGIYRGNSAADSSGSDMLRLIRNGADYHIPSIGGSSKCTEHHIHFLGFTEGDSWKRIPEREP